MIQLFDSDIKLCMLAMSIPLIAFCIWRIVKLAERGIPLDEARRAK
jgi:hypothetical protein